MPEVSLILFDLNGVLYHYDRDARIDALAAVSHRPAQLIRSVIWESGFEGSGDTGAVDADQYLRGFAAAMGYDLSEAEWVAPLKTAISPVPAALALLPRIRSGVTCAVLTNNNLLVQRHFPVLYPDVAARVGGRAYVSAEFAARKPDREAYAGCLACLGIEPAAALFIDDSDANVEGARAAGVCGCRVTSPDTIAAALAARDLLN